MKQVVQLNKKVRHWIAIQREDPHFQRKIGLGVLAFFLSLAAAWKMQTTEASGSEPPTPSVDSSIPDGLVLVPIQVQNAFSLDGVFDQTGYVDLYTAPEDPRAKSEKLFSGIKMIRSPHHSDQFSVLVPGESAGALAQVRGALFVVIQNRAHRIPERVQHPVGRISVENN